MLWLSSYISIEINIIISITDKKQGQEVIFLPLLSKNIVNRNDKSEHITHLDNVVRIIIVWSEWRDSNPRPLGPEQRSEIFSGYL